MLRLPGEKKTVTDQAFPEPLQDWQTPLPEQLAQILEDCDLPRTSPPTTAMGVGLLRTTLPVPPHVKHLPVP